MAMRLETLYRPVCLERRHRACLPPRSAANLVFRSGLAQSRIGMTGGSSGLAVFVQDRGVFALGSAVVATVQAAKRLEEPDSLVELVDLAQKDVYSRNCDPDQ